MNQDHRHHEDDHEGSALSETALRVKTLESLLVEKGYVDPEALDRLIDTYETKVGPRNGARVVARAWTDPEYRERLLDDALDAIGELDIDVNEDTMAIEVVENTPTDHHLVVCTLCSCYPWAVLGLPPTWYKTPAYRSRAVKDPRGLLREEFDLDLDDSIEIHVHDSTSELRYMVLPQRPPSSENLSEEELVDLVTRNAMFGVDRLGA